MQPASAQTASPAYRIVQPLLRSARGRYTGGALVFLGDTFVQGFSSVANAEAFIARQAGAK